MVSIYGDSYGTYFAQAFAVRHRERVRAVVLDAAFGVEGFDPWIREESVSLRFAWPAVCERTVGLRRRRARDASPLGRCGSSRRPLVARGRDADGGRHRIRVDGAALGQIAGDASYLLHGLPRPACGAARLWAGRPRAAAAHRRRGPAVHRRRAGRELLGGRLRGGRLPRLPDALGPLGLACRSAARSTRAARAVLAADAYAPFPNDIWLRSLYIDQHVTGCIEWPAPRYPDPPVPPGTTYPDMPVLVLVGDLDVITPLGDSRAGGPAVPELDARHRAQHRPRDGARRLSRLHGGDRPPLPDDAVRRRRELRRARPEIHVVPEFPRRDRGRAAGGERRRRRPLHRRRPPRGLGAAWTVVTRSRAGG